MELIVTMPQAAKAVVEGTTLVWVTQAGEHVSAGDILVEIWTDVFDAEIPSPTAGVLNEILVPIGTTVASRPSRPSRQWRRVEGRDR